MNEDDIRRIVREEIEEALRLSNVALLERNLRVIEHELDTPMRGHDEDGTCCLIAQFGVALDIAPVNPPK